MEPGRRPGMSDAVQRKQIILEMLNSDATYAEIGKQFGVSRQAIQRVAREADIRRPPGRKARARQQVVEAFDAHLLAKPGDTVRDAEKALGMPHPYGYRRPNESEQVWRARDRAARGMGLCSVCKAEFPEDQMAKLVRRCRACAREHNARFRKSDRVGLRSEKTADVVRLVEAGLTHDAVGRQLGISQTQVSSLYRGHLRRLAT